MSDKFIVGREAYIFTNISKGRRSAGFFSRVGGVLVTCSRLSSMTKKVEASSSSSFWRALASVSAVQPHKI